MTTYQVNQGNAAVVGDWEVGLLRARLGAFPLRVGSSSLNPPNLPPQEPQTMKLLFPPNPLKSSPPLRSHDRVLAGGVSGFQPESVNPVNELEFSVSSPEKPPSQGVFYQKPTESIPERVSERFIAGSPPSLLWSAPKLNPNGDSGQRVQGGGQNPVRH